MKYRRTTMPEQVKRVAVMRNMRRNGGHLVCEETKDVISDTEMLQGRVHFDHNPPLKTRYRRPDGTFEPDANDLAHIDVVTVIGHLRRTSLRRGLFPGDQTRIAKIKRLTGETPKKQKRKWPSRPFPKRPKACCSH